VPDSGAEGLTDKSQELPRRPACDRWDRRHGST